MQLEQKNFMIKNSAKATRKYQTYTVIPNIKHKKTRTHAQKRDKQGLKPRNTEN